MLKFNNVSRLLTLLNSNNHQNVPGSNNNIITTPLTTINSTCSSSTNASLLENIHVALNENNLLINNHQQGLPVGETINSNNNGSINEAPSMDNLMINDHFIKSSSDKKMEEKSNSDPSPNGDQPSPTNNNNIHNFIDVSTTNEQQIDLTTITNGISQPSSDQINIEKSEQGELSSRILKSSRRKRISTYVVGQERSNLFLVARDDMIMNKTCIELVEFPIAKSTKQSVADNLEVDRKIVYIHHSKMKCLYASINPQRNLLAFTHFYKASNNQLYYEIFIVEINSVFNEKNKEWSTENVSKFQEQQNRFIFRPPQTSLHVFQCIQFIHPPQTNVNSDSVSETSKNNPPIDNKNCRFVFVTEKESIKMFNIVFTESSNSIFSSLFKKNQSSKIVESIGELVIFVKNFIWWQYDPVRSLLYYMTISKDSSSNENSGTNQPDLLKTFCNLRCASISEKKPNQVLECTIPVTFPRSILERGTIFNEKIRIPWRTGPSSFDSNASFQIIRLENNCMCLCQQQAKYSSNVPDNFIDVAIFILHHKKKMHFTIPLPHDGKSPVNHPRVFFGSCRDTVIVYIPGWYLQIIDCSKDHEPWPLMNFMGPETVPFLDNESTEGVERKLEQDVVSLFSLSNSGGYILDLNRGLLFKYDFNFDNMLNWIVKLKKDQFNITQNPNYFQTGVPNIRKTTIQFLHLAITHFKNNIFTERTIRAFCEPIPSNDCDHCCHYVTLVDDEVLFMEYLIGAGYMELATNISASTSYTASILSNSSNSAISDREFLRYIPISLLECGDESEYLDDYSYDQSFVTTKIGNVMGNNTFTKAFDSIVRTIPYPRENMSCSLDLIKQVRSQISNTPKFIPLAVYLAHHKNHILTPPSPSVDLKSNNLNGKYFEEKNSYFQKKWFNSLFTSTKSSNDNKDDDYYEDTPEDTDDAERPRLKNLKRIDFYSEKSKTDFIDILSNFLLVNNQLIPIDLQEYNSSGPNKATRMKTILDYTSSLFQLSQYLFTTLTQILHTFHQKQRHSSHGAKCIDVYPMWYFNILQKLHVSLEETNFPSPSGFLEHFASVGVHVLPLNSLIQYINREMFIITDNVIHEVMKKSQTQRTEKEKKAWCSLMRTLVQKLRDRENRDVFHYERMINQFSTQPISENTIQNLLINYYHSMLVEQIDTSVKITNPKNINMTPLDCIQFLEDFKRQREENPAESIFSPFLPLSYYLLSIKSLNGTLLPKPTLLKITHTNSFDSSDSDDNAEFTSPRTNINFYSLLQGVEYCFEGDQDAYIHFLKKKTESVLSNSFF